MSRGRMPVVLQLARDRVGDPLDLVGLALEEADHRAALGLDAGARRELEEPGVPGAQVGDRALASSSRRPPLRLFCDRSKRGAGLPSARGKSTGKSSMLATEAPRQP